MILKNDKFVHVKFVQQPLRYLHVIWMKPHRAKDFRDRIDFVYAKMVELKVNKQLADTVNQKMVSKEDAEYAFEIIIKTCRLLPKPIYVAMLQSQDVFTQSAVQHFVNLSNRNAGYGMVESFQDEGKAVMWLKTRNQFEDKKLMEENIKNVKG